MECCETVNGVTTPILTYGRGIDDELHDVHLIVLLIPGNPGIIDFYRDFMSDMYDQLAKNFPNKIIPIWGICQAGHQCTKIKIRNRLPDLYENSCLYDLEGQVNHKIKFIQDCVPEHVKIIGIGHSIGCKIWSEMIRLYQPLEKRLLQCYMLFPTLERIQMTPNGQSILPYFRYERIIPYALFPLFYLPACIKRLIIRYYFGGKKVAPCVISATMHIFNLRMIQRSFLMTRSEFENVVDLDTQTLEKILPKLYFYFGTTDKWCPLDYALNMQIKLPQMKYKICELGLEHAFVLSGSSAMAGIVSELICNVLNDVN